MVYAMHWINAKSYERHSKSDWKNFCPRRRFIQKLEHLFLVEQKQIRRVPEISWTQTSVNPEQSSSRWNCSRISYVEKVSTYYIMLRKFVLKVVMIILLPVYIWIRVVLFTEKWNYALSDSVIGSRDAII